MFFDLRQPAIYRKKTLPVCHIKNNDDAVCSLVVSVRNRPISFLSCCIPDLQLALSLVDLQRSEAEIDANRADVILLEAIILLPVNHVRATYCKSNQKARLSNMRVTHKDHFEQIIALARKTWT